MKRIIISLLVIGFFLGLGIGFYIVKQNYSPRGTPSFTTDVIHKIGIIQPVNPPGDDYTHVLLNNGETIKLNAQQVNLNLYNGKMVTVSGQFSGTTLFVDTIKEREQ